MTRTDAMRLGCVLGLACFACTQAPLEECPSPELVDWGFDYPIKYDSVSPAGIPVDSSGQVLGAEFYDVLDQMTFEAEACLDRPVLRYCLSVKIPNDWFLSQDGRQQLLADAAPLEGCEAKGLDTSQGCFWRAGVQRGRHIIATPNLFLYKDALAKFITGREYVWNEFPECLSPGVDPGWWAEEP